VSSLANDYPAWSSWRSSGTITPPRFPIALSHMHDSEPSATRSPAFPDELRFLGHTWVERDLGPPAMCGCPALDDVRTVATATLVGIITAVVVRFATNLAIPGWASSAVGILLILFTQAVMASFVFSFAIWARATARHSCRAGMYHVFIGDVLDDTRPVNPWRVADSGAGERDSRLEEIMRCRRLRRKDSICSPPLCAGNLISAARCALSCRDVLEVGAGHEARRAFFATASTSAGLVSNGLLTRRPAHDLDQQR